MTLERMSKILGVDKTEVRKYAQDLDQKLSDTALTLVWSGDLLQLVTRPIVAKDIEALAKEEISQEISKAAAETLAIIAYKGPLNRSEIDFIRGVNSSYTLRNLMIRGLIERRQNPKDARTYIYQVSIDFLKFLGLPRIEELPDYAEFAEKLKQFLTAEPKES